MLCTAVITQISKTYIPIFWISIKFWIFRHLFSQSRNFDFWCSKTQTFENSRQPFSGTLNFIYFLYLLVAFYFGILHSRSIWMCADFRPEIAWHDVTKTPFLKSFWTDFAEIVFEDAKLMLNEVLYFWHRYMSSFLSYWESSLGGCYTLPQPMAALKTKMITTHLRAFFWCEIKTYMSISTRLLPRVELISTLFF